MAEKQRWEMSDFERLKAWKENKHPTCWDGCPLVKLLPNDDESPEVVVCCEALNNVLSLGMPCPVYRLWVIFGMDEA